MPWRRRAETLNERLAREAGLSLAGDGGEPGPAPESRLGRLVQPLFELAGVHAPHRARAWDVVASASVAGIAGDAVHFVALPDGGLLVDEEVPDDALTALADALEASLRPPYRAEAILRGPETWAIGARAIAVVELPDALQGEELELVVTGSEQALTVDGAASPAYVPELEELAGERESYVVRATWLEGRLWEAEIFSL